MVFEPVLVVHEDGQTRLLGMYELLLAQSHELTRANETIQQQIGAVEAASRAKSNFLANMSHEIRTPLNAIVGMTDLLLDSNLAPRQREYAGTVLESCETLLTIINEILDFSKIEAGRLTLEQTTFNLRECLGDTMKGLAVRAYRQGIELAFRCDADVPADVIGDSVRLRQVLLNLVGNAIKFTHEGEVVLDVRVQSRRHDAATIHFRVIDTGIGIPQDKMQLIFEAFEQADTSTTREYGGTGLGLAICTRLAGLMGGQLWVESEHHRGSTFHFTAAFGIPAEQQQKLCVFDKDLAAGTRVLVVDGRPTSSSILEEMLLSWQIDVLVAPSSEIAMAALAAAADSAEPFALVITDAQLPGGSGFELAESIRSDSKLSGTPILALIAADRSAIARADAAGVAGCLMKPVKQSELFNAIVAALGNRPLEAVAQLRPGAGEEPSLPPLRILVGEDSLVNQRLVMEILSRRGHTVEIAGNGEEVLTRLAAATFDLVLMDVQMPSLDGYEATRRIRSQEAAYGGHMPIVAMTAHALPEDRAAAWRPAWTTMLPSPSAPTTCSARIGAAWLGPPEPLTRPSRLPRVRMPPQPAGEIDWAEVLKTFDGDERMLRLIIETVLEESPRLLADMQDAITAADG